MNILILYIILISVCVTMIAWLYHYNDCDYTLLAIRFWVKCKLSSYNFFFVIWPWMQGQPHIVIWSLIYYNHFIILITDYVTHLWALQSAWLKFIRLLPVKVYTRVIHNAGNVQLQGQRWGIRVPWTLGEGIIIISSLLYTNTYMCLTLFTVYV